MVQAIGADIVNQAVKALMLATGSIQSLSTLEHGRLLDETKFRGDKTKKGKNGWKGTFGDS